MLDPEAVAALLAEAESGSHAEIRAVVDEDPDLDPDAAATALWRELDLDDVGVLVLIALGRREVRVVAGPALMAAVEETFWQDAADRVAEGFRAGDALGGLRAALAPIAELARRIAPAP